MKIEIVVMQKREFTKVYFPGGTVIIIEDRRFWTVEEYAEIEMFYTYFKYIMYRENIRYETEQVSA